LDLGCSDNVVALQDGDVYTGVTVWQRMQALLCQHIFYHRSMQERYHNRGHRLIFDNVIRLHPKGSIQVLQMFVTNVFDAKVIHGQVEPDGLCEMFLKARHVWLFKVPMACKTEFQELVSEDAALWESVHTHSDLHVDIIINGFFL
jgi:hypothetical protein